MSENFHAGELMVQEMAEESVLAAQNSKMISSHLSKGAAAFLNKQMFVVVAYGDTNGKVWISFLTGDEGFIEASNENTVQIHAPSYLKDVNFQSISLNRPLGLLIMDANRRIRLRINGEVDSFDENGLKLNTKQVYGNCPKYIRKRNLREDADKHRSLVSEHRSRILSKEHQEWIESADTFYIGSLNSAYEADASHRGGNPGFVQVASESELVIPDYFGNSMFNTLGNIVTNSATGLLFINYDNGHSLHLAGQAEVIWDENEIAEFPGASRLVRFRIDEVLQLNNGSRLGWINGEASPFNPTL
ncbi:pyridoxamine 5'-phosphate oxidase family protein [Paenibacillus sepulcri]|uniref:Pyridoxamine 5'-phosphate oxidase family protein n=1 Tax=Paenibacillus sepulcri TaxID=359917 RepID=A0ABS7C3G9_9BACL|nr:pyridoxamine 5'-phosphate oxidase family protein [Paenibacillus sepulcri]